MSYMRGRLFCNTLCPAGALLGLIARVSLFRIVIDKSACKDCGLCEKVCKAGCIDSENMRVDFSACVAASIASTPARPSDSGTGYPVEGRGGAPSVL